MAPSTSPVATDSTSNSPPPLGLGGTCLLFGSAGLLLFAITHGAIPALAARTNIEPIVLWFLSAGCGLFGPLLAVGVIMLRREKVRWGAQLWRERLRFRAMNAGDWLAAIVGLAIIAVLAGTSVTLLRSQFGEDATQPSFLRFAPVTTGRYWILAAWLPFWLVNILGEEFLWRGVVLPRQEVAFGRAAWLVNGLGWLAFHLSFGPLLLITLAPTTLVLPYLVQRRGNSWIGVVIHAGLNGPAFVAIAFGLG